jgi:hypothetical protein
MAPHQVSDPFPVYVVPATRTVMSVLQGCYITQYAQYLLIRNRDLVDGLITDAIWKIIRSCVTSILMLSIANVAIHVALAMGPKEDRALYEVFHTVVREELGISLEDYIVSDQGSAFRAICNRHRSEQFFCLSHFLVSLKLKVWSDEIGNLVRCRVLSDFQRFCATYEIRFAEALLSPQSPVARRLLKMLGRVELSFDMGRITIQDSQNWCSVSMMERLYTTSASSIGI